MNRLIPYQVDNVRIRYLPEQEAVGYATGIDMKINGEFVSGVQSWASLSVMTTQENIYGDDHWETNLEGAMNLGTTGIYSPPHRSMGKFQFVFSGLFTGKSNLQNAAFRILWRSFTHRAAKFATLPGYIPDARLPQN